MAYVDVSVEGADPIAARLARFQHARIFTEVADTITPSLVVALKLAAPKHTGKLADKIRSERHTSISAEAAVDIITTTSVPYAKYVLGGTKGPYSIYPKQASVLSWMGASGDQTFAAYVTNHPGMKANHFPRRVWQSLREPILAELVEQVRLRLTE